MNTRHSAGRASSNSRVETAPLLTVAYDEHLTYLRQKQSSPRTLGAYEAYLSDREQGVPRNGLQARWEPLLAWCRRERVLTCADLTKEVVDRYLDEQRPLSTQNTYRRIADFTRRFLRFAGNEGYIEPFHQRIPLPREQEADIAVFTMDEMLRMSKVVSKEHPRDWALFMTLVCTGLRSNEIITLTVDDIRWDMQELVVRREVSKNKRQRSIPMNDAFKALKKYWDTRSHIDAPWFFLSFIGSPVFAGSRAKVARRVREDQTVTPYANAPLHKSGLYHLVKKWGRLGDVKDSRCSPHTFRHFFAVQFLRNGGDLLHLKTWLGHSKFEMTEKYARLATTDLHEAARKVNMGAPFLQPRYVRAKEKTPA